MNKDVTWIFFDCFNTLIDDFDETGDQTGMKPLGQLAMSRGLFDDKEGFHRAYLTFRDTEWTGDSWHEVTLRDRLIKTIRLGHDTGLSESELVDELLHEFHTTYPPTVRTTPGAAEMLNEIGTKYRTGLISNFFLADYPEHLLTRFGLADSFDFILDSDQVGFKKPGLDIYHKALDLAGIGSNDTGQVLFIGDSLVNDVVKPQELGMRSIHFDRSGDRPNTNATPPGYSSITSWEEFHLNSESL